MKAWVLEELNNLQQKDVEKPTPKEDEVIVQIKAVGICSSDIHRVYTTGAYHYPIILGHEFSGITEEGKRVSVFPLKPCHTCESCKSGNYETCSNYSYFGSREDGAFAEYVAVPKWNLVSLPDNVTFKQAAMLEPTAVALHAVKKVDLSKANRVAVIGNGTIGELIGKWLKAYGVQVVDVIGRNSEPNYPDYDICFEVVGTTEAIQRAIELTKRNGEIVLVGNPDGNFGMTQKVYWQILRKQLKLIGSWNSSYPADWEESVNSIENLDVDSLISHEYKFEDLYKGFDMIYNKREKFKKVIVSFE